MPEDRSRPAAAARPVDIETLRTRYDALNKKKIEAETKRQAAEDNLTRLKEQARKNFGTDNLDELRKQLAELKAENERRRADYQAHLEQIEARLAEVEQQDNKPAAG